MLRNEAAKIGSSIAAVLLSLTASSAAFAYDDALVAAAKKEGQVTWYTTQIIDQLVRPAADAFQKEFGIKVTYTRANATDVALRISNEGKAKRVAADVFDGTDTVASLEKENLVLQWTPESASHWPKAMHDDKGFWTATNLYVLTPAYNTTLVPSGSQPKTWDDLLDPKWKGKMAWGSTASASAGPGFIGLVLSVMGEQKGEDYLKKLASQNITGLSVSARQVLDQVIAGEYSVALQTFDNHSTISAAQGAPVDWIAMNPAMALFSVVSVTKDAPHMNAGKLLVEFLTSKEGQEIFKKADYIPVDPDVAPKTPALRPDDSKFKAVYFTPEQIDEGMPKWVDLFKKYFR